ncbi:MAG TPA: hypothetical protein PLS03_13975 [Terrimicrobiaceae bacterium]|nr:hypothetical protein [Terrimicrobiaceae bacterium]
MNTLVVIILAITGLILAPFILKAVALAIWQVIEIPYRIVMLGVYGLAYVLISIWEAVVWIAKLLQRIWIWLFRR